MIRPPLSEIISWLQDAVLLVEPQATVIAANPGASTLFRRTSAELVGKPLTALVTDDPENIARYLGQCLSTSEGIQGGLHIQRLNEEPTLYKAIGGLVLRGEEEHCLVWLRFVARGYENERLTDSYKDLRTLGKENLAHALSEQRWRTAFENSAIGIMMADFTGRFLAANRVFRNMLGYTESELYQLTFLDVTYEEDRKANLDLIRELEESKRQHFQMEKRYSRKDGTLLWVRTNATLVPEMDGEGSFWINVVEDISDRKCIEDELRLQIARLRETETQLQAFFENSPNLIFSKDRQGRYLYTNKQFKKALRLTDEEIKGKRDDEVFSAEQAAAFQANDRRVFEARSPMEFEETALQEDGQRTSIVQKFPVCNAQGEIYAIGGIVTDITERKRAEKELLALRDELTAELTAMTRLHELSTRLLAISGFQALLEEVLDATIALQNADFGNIQLYNPEAQALEIVAQRGFQQDFLEYFRNVRDTGAACGRAMELRDRVIIEDVETDSEYAPHRNIAASAGFRAVQSTPLFSRSGEFLGMLSTHFRRPHRPSPRDLRFTDLYARYASEVIERKRLEAARQQVEEQYRVVVETANDAVLSMDEAGAILFANSATTRIFGYDQLELVGRPLTTLLPEFMRKPNATWFDHCLATGQRQLNWRGTEATGLRKNRQEFPVEISFGEMTQSGQRIFTGFIRDISQRRQTEQALQMAQVELARVSRLTTMGELAASIAHEINQPLAAVINNSDACLRLLADRNLEPEVLRQALEEIIADSTRASAVIARIRALIRKAPAEKHKLDVNEVIQEALGLAGRELHENRVQVERQLADALPVVIADRVQLQQVLLNLIMNGIEAMTPVHDRPRSLWLQSGMDSCGDVLVAVRDSGTGLASEGDRIFTPFFTTKTNGLGMGLAISRSLIEGHGGRLWSTPNLPDGAVFSFTLPVGSGS